ncbi:lytic murein transglycosylase [Haloechinothrix sp. LS1_15]|uniref:lytic transglycosylase domain-containing protein n=1 Tax=Haloechinothrix sp. LS1_15 TaxID=2652248 RepID=UPI0029453D88|nr:lytic murein transglycosylase [Haloechinothrix sp. LS1_15]MDV6012918.1 murein transglycosylase [Haloechinothrix sp. LS1_15]
MRRARDVEEEAGAEGPYDPPSSGWRRETGAVLVRLGVVAGVLVVAGGAVLGLNHVTAPEFSPTTNESPALSVEPASVDPGTEVPGSATVAGAADEIESGTGEGEEASEPEQPTPDAVLADWANRLGPEIGVPPRALIAYGRAELAVSESHPGCGLSWATLAGIGRIESYHGQYGGAVLQDNGVPSEPIIGVALDGSEGVKRIPDTDGGKWDGDPVYDRAVGPMQFIPSTWERFAVDGNGNGEAHPQQIDDAALAAAHYLCHSGRDMSSGQGWWAGVLAYNNSVEYGQRVFAAADQYAAGAGALD